MTRLHRLTALFASLIVGLGALLVPLTAWAETKATDFVKTKQSQLVELLKEPKSPKNDAALSDVFDGLLDYDSLARESMAENWDPLTAEQKKEFSSVLKQLVQKAYRTNLRKTLAYDVTFDAERATDKGVLVPTTAKNRKNKREDPVSVDYAVHQVDGNWRVFDIVTEGSSLVSNYRSQFRRVIKKKGFDELLKDMKKKLANG